MFFDEIVIFIYYTSILGKDLLILQGLFHLKKDLKEVQSL